MKFSSCVLGEMLTHVSSKISKILLNHEDRYVHIEHRIELLNER